MSHIYSRHIAIINCSNLGINFFFFLYFLIEDFVLGKYTKRIRNVIKQCISIVIETICGHTPSFLLCYHICRFLYHYKWKHLTYYRLCKRLTLLFDCHTSLIVALTCQFCVHVAKFPSLSLARYRSIYNSITFVI